MKNTIQLFFYLLFVLFTSCKSESQKNREIVEDLEIKLKAGEMVDSMVRESAKKVMFDTVGVKTGPIRVLSAKLIKQEYSNYRNISLTYKNTSNKIINGIRFRWYGENAFGEPADMGGANLIIGSEGFGGGFDDDPLGPGKTRTSQWSILSRDGRKVVAAWAYEVAFSDGTKWESSTK